MTVIGKIVLESGYIPVVKESACRTTVNKEIDWNIKQVPLTYKPLSQISLLLVLCILHSNHAPLHCGLTVLLKPAPCLMRRRIYSRFPAVLFVGVCPLGLLRYSIGNC